MNDAPLSAETTGPVVDLDAAAVPATIVNADSPDEVAADTGMPARAKVQADGQVLLELRHPVVLPVREGGQVAQRRFDQLLMRRITGADKRKAGTRSAEDQLVFLAAASTGLHTAVMNALYDQMDGEDCVALEMVMAAFLGVGQKTGR